ncbi:MAG TPA: response regulator [Gemmatimonadales bacterium]|nr:response regulator [Gemmatimonadales bacterium]
MNKLRTVLIVDDDALLRTSLDSVLTTVGYHTLTTGDPDAGYRLLATEPVTAVLLDVRLPTMSGLALYLAIVRRWPHLVGRIALMSGDADAADVYAWVHRNPCAILRKPFTFQQVTDWLDSAVHAAERTASAG